MTDILLWSCVPTTLCSALAVDTVIAIDFTWRLLTKLMEDIR
jgi:hypothetical protein